MPVSQCASLRNCCSRSSLAPGAEIGEVGQDADHKPSEPHAFATAFVADAVHAVVPVAGSHQWQAVCAVSQRRVLSPARQCSNSDAVSVATCGQDRRPRIGQVREAAHSETVRPRPAPTRRRFVTRRRRPHKATTESRPSSACAFHDRWADATSAAHRPRRTVAPRRAAGGRGTVPAACKREPARPAADRGIRMPRPADRDRCAPRFGNSASGTAASG